MSQIKYLVGHKLWEKDVLVLALELVSEKNHYRNSFVVEFELVMPACVSNYEGLTVIFSCTPTYRVSIRMFVNIIRTCVSC